MQKMPALIDDTGQWIDGVRVVGLSTKPTKSNRYWDCICRCGANITKRQDKLARGVSITCKSCWVEGMQKTRTENRIGVKHGLTGSVEYRTWLRMLARCGNANTKHWHRYGGRGIAVHPEWVSDFMAFYNHVGPRPSAHHSLDRINNDGNYEPGNVRWATKREQQNNFCRNRVVTYAGDQMTLIQAIRKAGLPESTVRNRLHKGWSEDRALTEPVRRQAA
jgi:hypothetical protein